MKKTVSLILALILTLGSCVALSSCDESKPDGIRLKAIDQLSKIQALYSDGSQVLAVGSLTIGDKRAKIDELLE